MEKYLQFLARILRNMSDDYISLVRKYVKYCFSGKGIVSLLYILKLTKALFIFLTYSYPATLNDKLPLTLYYDIIKKINRRAVE